MYLIGGFDDKWCDAIDLQLVPPAATTASTTTPALFASCNICRGRCGALGYAESFVSGGAVYLQEHPLSIA